MPWSLFTIWAISRLPGKISEINFSRPRLVKDTHWPAPDSSENMWEGTILSMPNTYHDRNEKTSGWCPSNWLLAATDAILSCLALCNLSRPCYPPWAIVTFMLPKILPPVSGFGPLKKSMSLKSGAGELPLAVFQQVNSEISALLPFWGDLETMDS